MAKERTREQLEEELNERLRFVKHYCITHQEMKEQNKRIEHLQIFLNDLNMKKVYKTRPDEPEVKQKTAEDEEREKQALLKLINES